MTTYLTRQRKIRGSRRRPLCAAWQLSVVLTLIFAPAVAPPAIAQQTGGDAGFAAEKGYSIAPVTIDGQTLFRVLGVTAFPARGRAEASVPPL